VRGGPVIGRPHHNKIDERPERRLRRGMSRTVAVIVHALIALAMGAMYFFFVIPRWWELEGGLSATWGLVFRIITGVLIGLAALPVVFTWLRTRRPEEGTPELALRLRLCSSVLHVVCAVLIIATAISEIWLTVDDFGRWLFGVYGAAAAIGLLGIFSFYLAFVAELPPPPPRPLKKSERKSRFRRRKGGDADDADEAVTESAAEVEPETETETEDAEPKEEAEAAEEAAEEPQKPVPTTAEAAPEDEDGPQDEAAGEPATKDTDDAVTGTDSRSGLRNRRPAGKIRRPKRFGKSSGGVAVEDE
jgi:hypothetical protein